MSTYKVDLLTSPAMSVSNSASSFYAERRGYGVDLETASVLTTSDPNPVYVYYRVYNQDGALRSKTATDPDEPFIGSIDVHQVAPPHTSSSVKRHIAKVENIADHTRTELFLTVASEKPMEKDLHMEILDGTGAGSSWDEPLAIVQLDGSS